MVDGAMATRRVPSKGSISAGNPSFQIQCVVSSWPAIEPSLRTERQLASCQSLCAAGAPSTTPSEAAADASEC